MRSGPKIILGGRFQSDRSIAVVKGEQSSLRQERELQRFDPSGYRSALGSTPLNPGAQIDGQMVSGRCQKLRARRPEVFSYLIKVDALGVIILMQAHGEAKREPGNDGFLGTNPLKIVEVIAAVKV